MLGLKNQKRINLYLDKVIITYLAFLAERKGCAMSVLIREIIQNDVWSKQVCESLIELELTGEKVPYNFYLDEELFRELQNAVISKKATLSNYITYLLLSFIQENIWTYLADTESRLDKRKFLPIETIYNESPDAYIESCSWLLENNDPEIYFLFNPEKFFKFFSSQYDVDTYIPKRIKMQIFAKGLLNISQGSKEVRQEDKQAFRQTKFLPFGISFENHVAISNNRVVLMKENGSTVSIEDKYIAQIINSFVSRMWNSII